MTKAQINEYLEALNDPHPKVRYAAAKQLGELRASEAVGPLIELLKRELPRLYDEDDDSVWLVTLDALQFIGTPSVRPLLRELEDTENDQELRLEVIEVLTYAGDPEAVPSLMKVLRDEDAVIRSTSAWALGALKAREAIEALLVALGDEDSQVRHDAAVALGELGDDRAVNPLTELLKDQTTVRSAAAEALGKLGDPRTIPALLLSQQKGTEHLHIGRDAKKTAEEAIEQNRSSESAVGESLGWKMPLPANSVKYGGSVTPFIQILQNPSSDLPARCAAALMLGQLGDSRAIDALLDALKSDDPDLRYSAAEAVGNLRDERATLTLIWMKHKDMALTSSGKLVCDAATSALEMIKEVENGTDPSQ